MRAVATLVLVISIGLLSSCSRGVPSEAEELRDAIVSRVFAQNGETWLAVRQSGKDEPYLVQLRHPRVSLVPTSLTETQRLNGFGYLGNLYVTCDQYREWRGAWKPWKDGTGRGLGDVVVQLSGGLAAQYAARIEQQNGTWAFVEVQSGSRLLTDRVVLSQLAQRAGLTVDQSR